MTENSPSSGWRGKTRGGTWGYLFFIGVIRFLGVKVAYFFLGIIVVYFIPFAPKATLSVWRYSRRGLKYGRFRSVLMLYRNYYLLGQVLIDKIAIGNGSVDRYHFEFERHEQMLDTLRRPGGVVVIGGHVGNWEIGAPFFDEYGKRMNIVMYDAEYRKIKEILDRNTVNREYKVIPVNRDSITHIFEIQAALNKDEYVCFQGDRFVNDNRTLTCEFLGRTAHFPAGPFQIAARMGQAVVFYFAMREKGMCYHFHFMVADRGEQMKPREREKYILQQYVNVLEKILKEYPEQWFNYYDFWKAGT